MANVLTIGEILLRLSTSEGNLIMQSHNLEVNYGGAEANVAIGLAYFGHRVQYASKIPDSPFGKTIVQHLRMHHVGTDQILIGGERLAIYFVEKGSSQRSSKIIYDRKHSSIAAMTKNEWDFDDLFNGIDLLHLSGITFGLSQWWRTFGQTLVKEAHKRNIQISFDINFRPTMWTIEEAKAAIIPILPMISFCSANYLDAKNFFGIHSDTAVPDQMAACYEKIHEKYPNIKAFYATKRNVVSSSDNDLTGVLWKKGKFVTSPTFHISPIVDRIGGGDAFAAGILHGLLSGLPASDIVRFGTAAAVLKHTIKGDYIQFTAREVQEWLDSDNNEIKR